MTEGYITVEQASPDPKPIPRWKKTYLEQMEEDEDDRG